VISVFPTMAGKELELLKAKRSASNIFQTINTDNVNSIRTELGRSMLYVRPTTRIAVSWL